ncbi:MAG: spore coat protein U domain-containing protein [Deltaproteobacteria bacterium]
MLRKKLLIAATVAATFLLAPRVAEAANRTATFTIGSTVAGQCSMLAPANVSLGVYDPFGTGNLTGTTTLRVKCIKGTGFSIALSSSNSFRMADGAGNFIPYAIKQPDNSTNWETTPLVVPGSAITDSRNYYTYVANVSAAKGLPVPLGDYSDVVTVTITY